MIETERLKIYPASHEQMRAFLRTQTVDVLKSAYTEILNDCLVHQEQWDLRTVFMIELKDGNHIGELCIRDFSYEDDLEIGCGIDWVYEGQGYVTEAAEAIAKWAFQKKNTVARIAELHNRDVAFMEIFDTCSFVQSGTLNEVVLRIAFKSDEGQIGIDLNALTLYDIYRILEDQYGFDFECEIAALYIKNPEDEMLKYYHDRLNDFKVWSEKRALYDLLNETAQTMFITLTDKYGERWKLYDLLKTHPADDLPKALDSYFDYLDRVGDLYSSLKNMGYDLNDL